MLIITSHLSQNNHEALNTNIAKFSKHAFDTRRSKLYEEFDKKTQEEIDRDCATSCLNDLAIDDPGDHVFVEDSYAWTPSGIGSATHPLQIGLGIAHQDKLAN